jgi:hypothetical protein
MTTAFRIRDQERGLALLAASSVEEAAARFVRRRYGASAIAWRTTGAPGRPGWFQPYRRASGGLTIVGPAIYVVREERG